MAMTRSAPKQESALDRELADGAAAPDGDGLAALQITEISRHEARGEDVGQEKDLFVAQSLRHLDWADVGIGDAEIFGLAAGIAAEHVRVAEEARGGVTPELFGHLVIGVGALAAGEEALLAEEAFPAGDGEGNDDAVADLQLLVFGADLDDFAHGLVTQDVALFHRRHDAVKQMQVRTADGAGGDFDDGVSPVLDLGIRHAVAADVVLAVPGQRFHPKSPCREMCRDKFRKKNLFLRFAERQRKAGVNDRMAAQETGYVRFPTVCDRHRCFYRHRI